MSKIVVGVDLGGTNIAGVLIDEKGELKGSKVWPTEAEYGPEHILRRIIELIRTLLEENGFTLNQLQGVGVGVPGLVNTREGRSIISHNLPGWKDIAVAQKIHEEINAPVFIENDVRMAAWGEKLLGAGQDKEDIVCLTLGTGIGSGIFIQGKMFKGRKESAGEIGHMTVEKDGLRCNCGNYGCLELYASGRGIARRAKEALANHTSSLILKLVNGDINQITAATVCTAAKQGDELALKVIKETALYLGIGLANVANLLNPQRIILGGGVMQAGELLLEPTREVVYSRALPLNREVEIVPAKLGEWAGAIGGAMLAKMQFIEGRSSLEWVW
ncbi:glucokinase [Thermanaeromonas toyohensis ToBE]|uniref:Glucokinase n=1 Tax=Thermanaeromonas toyohensis ToBE TaxID=698762 RepID=A0A1W1VVU3_9FIRM|nr:ROK family protein [Thermanaeromonas toyohensis]SMB97456.1 glucokinase [Thermanaeromonas toyohensis ToBE]